jgi:hypothetical protein
MLLLWYIIFFKLKEQITLPSYLHRFSLSTAFSLQKLPLQQIFTRVIWTLVSCPLYLHRSACCPISDFVGHLHVNTCFYLFISYAWNWTLVGWLEVSLCSKIKHHIFIQFSHITIILIARRVNIKSLCKSQQSSNSSYLRRRWISLI